MKRTCIKCKGYGHYMPPEGTTRADIKTCPTCNGDGYLPDDYIVNPRGVVNKSTKHKSSDGREFLKKVVAV